MTNATVNTAPNLTPGPDAEPTICRLHPSHAVNSIPCNAVGELLTGRPCRSEVTVVQHQVRLNVHGIASRHGRDFGVKHYLSTLSGYGAQYGDYDGPEGMAKYEAALKRNGKSGAAWINAEAVVLSAHPIAEPPRIDVTVGQLVWLSSATPGEGGWYRIVQPSRWSAEADLVRWIPPTTVPADS